MRYSTDLPDLRMLPTPSLVPHEDTDPRRVSRLAERLAGEDYLKNPPIVARIPEKDQFVILDGANRVSAFMELKIPHIVAQVVSYADPGVILDTWYHVVSGLDTQEFEDLLNHVEGLSLKECSLDEARSALATNTAAAYIICCGGVRMAISPEGKLLHDIHLLNNIVGAYKGKANIFRASNDIWEKQVPYYPHITALVVFPKYTPKDILMVAANGYRVPSGVTRHIIPNRALHINIPLEILRADWGQSKKEDWLHEWLMERMASNAIRYYSESTFSFDE
jgi:hypothetical protein